MFFIRVETVSSKSKSFQDALLLIAKMKTTAERRWISNDHDLDDLIYTVRYYLKSHNLHKEK